MKFDLKLNIANRILDADWPEGVPLPMAGDKILMRIDDEAYGFIVRSRFYSIGVDHRNGKPLTVLTIEGEQVLQD